MRGGDGTGAHWVGADIAVGRPLPVGPSDVFVRVSADGSRLVGGMGSGAAGRMGDMVGCWSIVGLKDIEALELLVKDGEGLELFGLVHLGLEPVLDLILLLHDKVLVCIVEVSGTCQGWYKEERRQAAKSTCSAGAT